MPDATFALRITFLMSGLLIWAAHFLFIYGFNGLVCARNLQGAVVLGFGIVPLTIVAATVLALTADIFILATAVAGLGPGISDEASGAVRGFWRFVTAAVALLALIAIVWDALPVLIVPPCA